MWPLAGSGLPYNMAGCQGQALRKRKEEEDDDTEEENREEEDGGGGENRANRGEPGGSHAAFCDPASETCQNHFLYTPLVGEVTNPTPIQGEVHRPCLLWEEHVVERAWTR